MKLSALASDAWGNCARMLNYNMDAAHIGVLKLEVSMQGLRLMWNQQQLENLANLLDKIQALMSLSQCSTLGASAQTRDLITTLPHHPTENRVLPPSSAEDITPPPCSPKHVSLPPCLAEDVSLPFLLSWRHQHPTLSCWGCVSEILRQLGCCSTSLICWGCRFFALLGWRCCSTLYSA